VDGAAPSHVSLRRAHEHYLGCDHATYPYDGNATFQNRIQGHKRTISQLRAHLIKARLTIAYDNVLTMFTIQAVKGFSEAHSRYNHKLFQCSI